MDNNSEHLLTLHPYLYERQVVGDAHYDTAADTAFPVDHVDITETSTG